MVDANVFVMKTVKNVIKKVFVINATINIFFIKILIHVLEHVKVDTIQI